MYTFISAKKVNVFYYITIIMTVLWSVYGVYILGCGAGEHMDEVYFIIIPFTMLGIFIAFVLRSLYHIAKALEETYEQLGEVRREQRKQSGE